MHSVQGMKTSTRTPRASRVTPAAPPAALAGLDADGFGLSTDVRADGVYVTVEGRPARGPFASLFAAYAEGLAALRVEVLTR